MRRLPARALIRAVVIAIATLLVGKVFELLMSKDGLIACTQAQAALTDALGDLNVFGLVERLAINIASGFSTASEIYIIGEYLPGIVNGTIGWFFAVVWTPVQIVQEATVLEKIVIGFEVVAGVAFAIAAGALREFGEADGFMGKTWYILVNFCVTVVLAGTAAATALWLLMQGGLILFDWFLELGGLCLTTGVVTASIYLVMVQLVQERVADAVKGGVTVVTGGGDGPKAD